MENHTKRICKCSKKLQKVCKHKVENCQDVAEIVEALLDADTSSNKKPVPPAPKLRVKKHKKKPENLVPMAPPMDSRLRFIGHCPIQTLDPIDAKTRNKFYSHIDKWSDDDEPCGLLTCPKRKICKKRVHYVDPFQGNVTLPLPELVIKHGCDNQEILNVVSPKTSGEIIQAQPAVVSSEVRRPPLPAQSGHKLFKPHSGIIVNRDEDFVPDVVAYPSRLGEGIPSSRTSCKSTICHKRRACGKSTCKRKKCRRLAQLKKKNINKRIRQRNKQHLRAYYAKLGVSDGKPRAHSTTGHSAADDDEYCGLDEIPRPQQIMLPHMKRGTLQTHSLTVLPCTKDKKPELHYGILTGSVNMYDSKFGARSRGRQALPMSVMAYCLAFHYHPKQWTMKLIDNLIDAGDKWYLICADKVHDHSAVQGMCEVLPFGKKQILVLNRKRMQILLGEPDIVGYTMSKDPTVYNLCRGLKAFFKENRAGIMMTRVLKVVIWKDKICYYIFDPAGRDSKAYSNFSAGTAALVNVKNVEAVAEVLLARSIVEDQKFVLAPLKVIKIIDEKEDDDLESDKELTQTEKAMMGYKILNESCAIVNANMHLGDRCFEDAKFRQALPIAVIAMTYAKISPPNTWHTKTIDKILRLGNKLHVDCSNPKVMIDLTIDNIPNEIIIGPYACEIIIYRERTKGQMFTTKECLLNIKTGIKDFFSKEYSSGILQFNNYSLAVWKQKDMYYLFDPYPRTADGLTTPQNGKACVLMLLSAEAMSNALEKNWNYLPITTQFNIHAFKVLKLKKRNEKSHILCTLSDTQLHGKKTKREVLSEGKARGDHTKDDTVFLGDHDGEVKPNIHVDEEQMGDIVSLIDSIQDDFLPPIPLRYKNVEPTAVEDKIVNLDSPTVSVTQIVPPWPRPRDKTADVPDLDPEPEPEPEPEPIPEPLPEGYEEEELGEEEEMERQRREEERKRLEEEERNKPIDLPSPLPPPPPTPQEEPELACPPPSALPIAEDPEIQAIEPVVVDRKVLLTEDAKYRHKLRQQRRKISQPLVETHEYISSIDIELTKPNNFKQAFDGTQIIRGKEAIIEANKSDILPFAAIMAIVTSYKYSINTWTPGIVSFVVETSKKLFQQKREKFQFAPIHVIPKIALGKQAYQANIDVIGEGPTWNLEDILRRKFFSKTDRGMVTTSAYSCAIFKKNGLFYLYDAASCNALGLRDDTNKGKAAFMRFTNLHDLVNRIEFNKDGISENQQFILSRVVVRMLLKEPRLQLPEDYDYDTGKPKSNKSKMIAVKDDPTPDLEEKKSKPEIGYQLKDGAYRIEGTTGLKSRGSGSADVKACHFISLIAMLMATMHPVRTWDRFMVDTAIEKGLEIYGNAKNLNICEKRLVKNIMLEGKFINANIKRLIIINDNVEKTLEQYLDAVLQRLRYVIIRFPQASMVICQTDGYFHLFDPYSCNHHEGPAKADSKPKIEGVASWTLYRSFHSLCQRIRKTIVEDIDSPEFYRFELTSLKKVPRNFAWNYRLGPLFKPDENPNSQYLKRRKLQPIVDEKMYWVETDELPWSRMTAVNDLGLKRKLPQTMWKNWDIEFPGDLFSLWGTIHLRDSRFDSSHRGNQYLHACTVALAVTQCCDLSAWTPALLDGIVTAGDRYYSNTKSKVQGKKNLEMTPTDLDPKFDDMYPYSFSVKFENIIFGFMYNLYPDRFNLSKALLYFFEKHDLGILVGPYKNLAFGRVTTPHSRCYFMFDCQSFGAPVFVPGQGSAYILKCESLNRLIYCIALTLNIKRHGQQFHLYSATITLSEKSK